MGAKLQKTHSRVDNNTSWMKFNKGEIGIRILKKREKWIWDVYSKEKWFWEDTGSKLIRVRSKVQVKTGKKRKKERKEKKKKKKTWRERKHWDKISYSSAPGAGQRQNE